jgi:hypothetical protein
LAVLLGLLDIYRYHHAREAAITTDPTIELKLLSQRFLVSGWNRVKQSSFC